jgi:hypothetical protein
MALRTTSVYGPQDNFDLDRLRELRLPRDDDGGDNQTKIK